MRPTILSESPSSALTRLERTSRRLADLFATLVPVIPLLIAFSVFAIDTPEFRARIGWDHIATPIPLFQRLLFVVTALLLSIPMLLSFVKLRQLFLLYAKGIVFDARNVALLRCAGRWLLWSAACGFLNAPILSLLGSIGAERRSLRFDLSTDMLLPLIAGGTIYAIAYVMELARDADQERSQFV
jgi:hypothetical protein